MSDSVKTQPSEEIKLVERAVTLAEELLERSLYGETSRERARGKQMQGLISDSKAKRFAMLLADRVFRSRDSARTAKTFRSILQTTFPGKGMNAFERALLKVGGWASRVLPEVVLAGLQIRLRQDSRDVVLSAENAKLTAYLKERRTEGMRVNVNQLGEAILGEGEAVHRVEMLESLLARPDVDYVSVKISAIASQLNLLAWDRALSVVKERMRRLYRAALKGGKLVNLDMEEYRDLHLTVAAFTETLDEPEFKNLRAGIVLQAYLPDSWAVQQELTEWARRRVENGGMQPKLRLVKGANLAMETVEAEMHGWYPAPYASKAETDANFKRMLEFACRPENASVLRVGVASHNLFDIALTLTLREREETEQYVELEMLEGMANQQARAVGKLAGGVLFYAPITYPRDFGNALAYLIRRLDENTSPENFLHDLFNLSPGGEVWARQAERFRTAWNSRLSVLDGSRRATLPPAPKVGFYNEADTDWTQRSNREAVHAARAALQPPVIPALESLETVLERARVAQSGWEATGTEHRSALLRRAADVMAERRMELIAILCKDGRKAITDADTEISEAIDFARYYAHTGAALEGTKETALGVVVIAPPWNFPFAIPAGGVLAALIAGNSVIFKPAPQTVLSALAVAEALWAAGIPRDVLQFFPCQDGEVGRALITDPRVGAVVLTGAYETASMFLDWRPSLRLFAETSGKNALVVTALADRDLAIKDLVRSAFGHSGQKCSAASLAILEAEVYDDPAFRRQLLDAAQSLPVGPAEDAANIVTPLVCAPGESLSRALTKLEEGETWLLEPRQIGETTWTPGIRLNVQPGSWFHQTECFGPVLGIMRARDLDHAIELQNGAAYGLTAGLHSLDEKEIALWRERVQAGNLYINRGTTGAIVQRQPFGGWKRSSIGPGSKAGGPNYVRLFARSADIEAPTVEKARKSYAEAWQSHFGIEHDPSALKAESNDFRYRPSRGVIVRLQAGDTQSVELAKLAAATCGVHVEISAGESDDAFIARIPVLAQHAEFLRTVEVPSDAVLRAAYAAGLNWICAPLSAVGRLELPRWMREQVVAETRHRYGNILDK